MKFPWSNLFPGLMLAACLAVAAGPALGQVSLPVGTLAQDGPATPEQISLLLPVTGSLSQTATATVRYRQSGASSWTTGHPLYRIRPDLSETPAIGSVPDAFAWPIIDLIPGTSYDIEVTVTSSGQSVVKTLSTATRALPALAGAPNKTASSAGTIASQFATLSPGDVLEIADGNYTVSGLELNTGGTSARPIYIRGHSRAGTILHATSGAVLRMRNASYVVLENLTLQGSATDSGTAGSSWGVELAENAGTPYNQTQLTFRNLTVVGVDRGISAYTTGYASFSQMLVYDSTLIGNNTWTGDRDGNGTLDIDSNDTWNDDGIMLAGGGNCAFNNTLKGFGDTFAFATHNAVTYDTHVYRNDVQMGGDDLAEVDESQRNIAFYDNRSRNTMTVVSLDPLYGGPLLVARNIVINTGRTPFKWNSANSGQFIYNNTIVRTTGKYMFEGQTTAEAGWYQPNNGDQRSYGYRNNLLVYRGSGTQTIRLDNTGHDPVDFTHNSWYPDRTYQWNQGTFANLAGIYAGLPATTPVFSGSSKRHEQDNITTSNPWITTIALGSDYHTEVTAGYEPALAAGTTPKNSGAVIANVTDGYSGSSPDRGAVIAGRPSVQYGDRIGTGGTGTALPTPPTNLRAQ
jgi:hypothetical protein